MYLPTLILLTSTATAHFLLNYPNTIGFDDDKEGTAPCGGFDITFSNSSMFHVDGDVVALTSTHPQANWLFRATLDKTAMGNWTNLLPDVAETGLGAFCETDLKVPTEWAGQQGILQVVQAAADGNLYQVSRSLSLHSKKWGRDLK